MRILHYLDSPQLPSIRPQIPTIEKKYKLLFHNGSFLKKSINVWYSKAQLKGPWEVLVGSKVQGCRASGLDPALTGGCQNLAFSGAQRLRASSKFRVQGFRGLEFRVL